MGSNNRTVRVAEEEKPGLQARLLRLSRKAELAEVENRILCQRAEDCLLYTLDVYKRQSMNRASPVSSGSGAGR